MRDGVVIAGGGLAGQRCCETLRARGYEGPIRLVCAEDRPPYDRPPLSKGLLAGTVSDAEIALRPEGWHERNDIDILLATRAVGLDPAARRLALAGGPELRYDELLIATGARPRALPLLAGRSNVTSLSSSADAHRLRAALVPGARLAIVGAGFIGLEVAATARARGVEVTVVEAAPVPLAAAVGTRVGAWFADFHRARGVELLLSARIAGMRSSGGRTRALELDDGRRVDCDHVVVGVGVRPATDWLGSSGSAVEGAGPTPLPHVYAAGDAAGGGHWETAAREGAAAACAMLGERPPPTVAPSFWSDQHGVRIQLVGDPRRADAVTLDGDLQATYTRAGHAVARLLVNRPRDLPSARAAVQAGLTSLDPRRYR